MLVKHMRLTKDIIVNENNGRKYGLGSGVYDIYKGKNSDGSAKYEPVYLNLLVNGDREIAFLENFGKKGSLLKITGEISPGKPYKNASGEYVSVINLAVRTVDFSEVRVAQSKEGTGNGSGNASTPPPSSATAPSSTTQEAEVKDIDEVFDFWEQQDDPAS